MTKWHRLLIVLIVGCLAAPALAFAKDDRVSFGSDITVQDGSTSGDLVCVLCSVKVHGEVHGDVVAVLGSVTVNDGRSISGDLVTIGGDVSLSDNARINGDVSVVAGDLYSGPGVSIGGERNVVAGRGWLLLPLAPLLIFIGLVWLIVWLVSRRRYQFPMYPQGRGF